MSAAAALFAPLASSLLSSSPGTINDAAKKQEEEMEADADRKKAERGQQRQAGAALVEALETPKFGAERYIEEQLNSAGGRTLNGRRRNPQFSFASGKYKGKTMGQAAELARAEYAALPDEQRRGYEDAANLRDVTSGREQGRMQDHRTALAVKQGLAEVEPGGAQTPAEESSGAPNTTPTQTYGAALGPSRPPLGVGETGRGKGGGLISGTEVAPRKPGTGLDYLRPRAEVEARAAAGAAGREPTVTARPPQQTDTMADIEAKRLRDRIAPDGTLRTGNITRNETGMETKQARLAASPGPLTRSALGGVFSGVNSKPANKLGATLMADAGQGAGPTRR